MNTQYIHEGMERLILTARELSAARKMNVVTRIVSATARELTGADGATVILRDGNESYYADENAISSLWKGSRFPLNECASGWVMLNKKTGCHGGHLFRSQGIPQNVQSNFCEEYGHGSDPYN